MYVCCFTTKGPCVEDDGSVARRRRRREGGQLKKMQDFKPSSKAPKNRRVRYNNTSTSSVPDIYNNPESSELSTALFHSPEGRPDSPTCISRSLNVSSRATHSFTTSPHPSNTSFRPSNSHHGRPPSNYTTDKTFGSPFSHSPGVSSMPPETTNLPFKPSHSSNMSFRLSDSYVVSSQNKPSPSYKATHCRSFTNPPATTAATQHTFMSSPLHPHTPHSHISHSHMTHTRISSPHMSYSVASPDHTPSTSSNMLSLTTPQSKCYTSHTHTSYHNISTTTTPLSTPSHSHTSPPHFSQPHISTSTSPCAPSIISQYSQGAPFHTSYSHIITTTSQCPLMTPTHSQRPPPHYTHSPSHYSQRPPSHASADYHISTTPSTPHYSQRSPPHTSSPQLRQAPHTSQSQSQPHTSPSTPGLRNSQLSSGFVSLHDEELLSLHQTPKPCFSEEQVSTLVPKTPDSSHTVCTQYTESLVKLKGGHFERSESSNFMPGETQSGTWAQRVHHSHFPRNESFGNSILQGERPNKKSLSPQEKAVEQLKENNARIRISQEKKEQLSDSVQLLTLKKEEEEVK